MTLTFLLLLTVLEHVSAHPTARTDSVTTSSKAGVAGGGDWSTDMSQFTTGKVSWYYTWSPSAVDDTQFEFVPMLWGQNQVAQWTDSTSGINATIAAKKPTAILGMNEPQEKGQSNMTPQQGADMWKTYIEPLRAQGLRLGSPAPSGAPSGKTWLQDFLTACNGGCTVDFIALHYYDVNATQFAEYITDFHNTFQRPIWVTEIACQNFNKGPQCTQPETAQFLSQAQGFMDSQDWVERYAWFGVMRDLQGVNPTNAMLDKSGKITALGRQYLGTEAPQTSGAPSGTGGLPGFPTNAGILARASWSGSMSWLLVVFLAALYL